MTPAEPMAAPRYSVVIPCYGSRKSLPELLERLIAFFDGRGDTFEVICVDDLSPDGLFEVLEQAHHDDPRIRALQHFRNSGQHQAILTGIRHARGLFVVTMDDDLQHPPEEIGALIDGLGEHDAVVGMPAGRKQHAGYRNLGSRVMRAIIQHAFNPPPGHVTSAFRLMRGDIARQLAENRTSYPYISGMLLRVTQNVANVPFRHEPRRFGASGYSLVKMLRLASNLVVNYTKLPLQAVVSAGAMVSLASLLGVVWIVVQKLFFVDFQSGWASIIAVVGLLGGLNLLGLAIIGEYLIRLIHEGSGWHVPAVRQRLPSGRHERS